MNTMCVIEGYISIMQWPFIMPVFTKMLVDKDTFATSVAPLEGKEGVIKYPYIVIMN